MQAVESTVIGICLAILTSLMWNVAPVIQKEALGTMDKMEGKAALKYTKHLFKNKRWLLGFALALIGALTYLVATEMAGIVAVQPLMNVGLVALAVLSNRRLGEPIDVKAKAGILLLILTPVLIALGGVTEPLMFTGIEKLVVYCMAMLVLLGLLFSLSRRIPILWAPITSILQALAAQFTQWFTLVLRDSSDLLQGLLNGLVPLVLMGVLTFIAGVYAVSIGLQRNPAARFNAITGTVSMIAVIVGGIVIFSQALTYVSIYVVGVAFGIIGVLLLSRYQR